MRVADWIKLYQNVDKNPEFRAYEEAMRQGKKGVKRRQAEDTAFAQVIRLYLLLGQTKDGRIRYKDVGDRLLAEDVMREEGDDLVLIFDRMAVHGVIGYDEWTGDNIVTTSNAKEQADMRSNYKARSWNANQAKREKAEKERRKENQ